MLRNLTRLGVRGCAELFEAQVAILYATWLVRTRPRGKLVKPLTDAPAASPREDLEPPARRLANAIELASRRGVSRPQCLTRAIALQRLLEFHGIRGSRIRIGVNAGDEGFRGHAWVQYGTLLLGDRVDHVRSFSGLTDVQLAGRE